MSRRKNNVSLWVLCMQEQPNQDNGTAGFDWPNKAGHGQTTQRSPCPFFTPQAGKRTFRPQIMQMRIKNKQKHLRIVKSRSGIYR